VIMQANEPRPKPFCTKVFGDIHREEIVVHTNNGCNAVMSLAGNRLSPVFNPPPDYPRVGEAYDRIAMLPRSDNMAMGRYRGDLQVVQWRTGEVLWNTTGLRNMDDIAVCNEHTLVIHRFAGSTGTCIEIDALTGERFGRVGRVAAAAADSMAARILLLRKNSFRVRTGMLELRTSLRTDPIVARTIELDDLREVCFGDDWLAFTENKFGSVWCFSTKLQERWRYVPEAGFYFLCLCPLPGGESIFGLRRGPSPEIEPLGMIFDVQTGRVLDQQEIPLRHIWTVPVANGSIVASPIGIIRLPEMRLEAREFHVACDP
jgi:hypothetical protein